MDKTIFKTYSFETKQLDEAERTLVAVASTEEPDRDGDVLMVDGWRLDNYRKNPVVLFGHQYDSPPVAKVLEIQAGGGMLRFKAQFATAEEYPFADTVYRLFKGGYLRSFSVGFTPRKWEDRLDDGGHYMGRKYLEQDLLEISAVNIPTHPKALVEAVKSGIKVDKEFLCTGCAHHKITPNDSSSKDTSAEDTKQKFGRCDKQIREGFGMEVALHALLAETALIVKAGRVVSEKNRGLLQQALEAIEAILAADEDKDYRAVVSELAEVTRHTRKELVGIFN